MDLKVNEYIGKPIRPKEDHLNIYAFLFNDEVSIELVGINYPVGFVAQKVVREKISRMGFIREQLENRDYITEMERINYPSSMVHLIFSRSSKRLMVTDDNDESDHSHLIDEVKNWLASYSGVNEVESADEIDIDSDISFWPHRSYVAMPLWAFSGLKEFLDMDKLGDFSNVWVVLYDTRDPKIIQEIQKQVSPSRKTLDSFKDSVSKGTVFLSDYDLVLNSEKISSPLILLNKEWKSEFDIEKSLFSFFSKALNLSMTMDSQIKQKQYLGYDIQDLFYFNFGDKKSLDDFSSSFDSGTDPDKRDAFLKKLADLEVDLNDSDTVKFAKTLSVYLKSFPANNKSYHYKIFYSIVSVPMLANKYPESPVTKNEGLFESFFSVIDGPALSKGRAYYLISSKFCFPKSVFNLFIQDSGMDLHEVLEFNGRNNMLSKYCFLDNVPKDNVAKLDYHGKVVVPFVKSIEKRFNDVGQEIEDNRFDEMLSVKRLSEFPYASERVESAFDREGIEFKDINVIFVNNPGHTNVLGGYDCKRLGNEENVSLVEGYSKFPLPLMMFNIANKSIQREDLSGTIIHEGKHYLDDMRVDQGKESQEFFNMDYVKEPDRKKRYEKYLSSQAETSAFAEDALNVLRHYRLEYIYANWIFLKTRIIHEYFSQQKNINHYALPQYLMEAYSRIMEKALDLYEQEEQKKFD